MQILDSTKGLATTSTPPTEPSIDDLRAYGRKCCYPDLTEPQDWYTRLVPLIRPKLVRFLRYLLTQDHVDMAEDIVQQTLMAGWTRAQAGTLRPNEAEVSNWLMAALRDNLMDYYRKVNRYRKTFCAPFVNMTPVRAGSDPENWGSTTASANVVVDGKIPSPENAYITEMDVREAMQSLTPKQAFVMSLYFLEGYTTQEIADMRERALSSTTELLRATCANLRKILR